MQGNMAPLAGDTIRLPRKGAAIALMIVNIDPDRE